MTSIRREVKKIIMRAKKHPAEHGKNVKQDVKDTRSAGKIYTKHSKAKLAYRKSVSPSMRKKLREREAERIEGYYG